MMDRLADLTGRVTPGVLQCIAKEWRECVRLAPCEIFHIRRIVSIEVIDAFGQLAHVTKILHIEEGGRRTGRIGAILIDVGSAENDGQDTDRERMVLQRGRANKRRRQKNMGQSLQATHVIHLHQCLYRYRLTYFSVT